MSSNLPICTECLMEEAKREFEKRQQQYSSDKPTLIDSKCCKCGKVIKTVSGR